MGGAMAKALHQADAFTVSVVESDEKRRSELAILGIPAHATIAEAEPAESYILAIKPQQFAEVAAALTHAKIAADALLVSIMAGIPLAQLQPLSKQVVRAMPNLPAIIHESMSVLCGPSLDKNARAIAEQMFATIGDVAWVNEESQLHAVTAISGSGPGYVFAFMEVLERAALAHGLQAELAQKLVRQTVRGAALLADASVEDFALWRARVTSQGGTTQAALSELSRGQFDALIAKAVDAAAARSKELATKQG